MWQFASQQGAVSRHLFHCSRTRFITSSYQTCFHPSRYGLPVRWPKMLVSGPNFSRAR